MTTKIPVELSSTPSIVDNGDATAITIDSSEKVGIGETSPLGTLHVKTADSSGSADSGADELVLENSGDTGMTILSGTSNSGSIRFGDSGDNDNGIIIYNHGSSPYMRFFVDASERMRILSSGGLTFNGDTAAANALDDYEEGSWSPTIVGNTGASGQSYSIQYGTYTRIGNFVHLTFDVRLSTKGTLSGTYVNIGGHGFTFKGNNIGGTSLIGYSANTSNITDHPIVAYINSTNVYLMYAGNGYVTTAGNFINDNTVLIGTITGIIN